METYTLVFTGEELNTIFEALQEVVYKKAVPVINTIQMQIQAAQENKEENKKEENIGEEK